MRNRLLGLMLAASLGVALPGLLASYLISRSSLVEQAYRQLDYAVMTSHQNLRDWIMANDAEARFLLDSADLARAAASGWATAWLERLAAARPWMKAALLLSRPDGRIVASSRPSWEGSYLNLSEVFVEGQKGFHMSKVSSFPLDLRPTLSFSSPLNDRYVVAFYVNFDRLAMYADSARALGPGTRMALVTAGGETVTAEDLGRVPTLGGRLTRAVAEVTEGRSGHGSYLNSAGRPVLGAWAWLPRPGLGIIVETEEAEALTASTWLALLFLGLAAALSLGAVLLAWRFSASVTRPLEALSRTAALLTSGQGPPAWPPAGNDEVGELNRSLRSMTESLETRVAERTADLKATIEELNTTRNKLVESGKLALLGTLVASISHELNTPLGALVSSSDHVKGLMTTDLLPLVDLLRTLDDAEAAFLGGLIANGGSRRPLQGSERRKAVKRLKAVLAAAGYEREEATAEALVEWGLEEPPLTGPFAPREGATERVLAGAWKLASLGHSVTVIQQAAQRASRVVSSLQIYARQDHDERPAPTDLAAELDLLLQIYYSSVRRGVQIVRSYASVAPYPCRRDRLNQVWANLINNAIFAVGTKGRVELGLHETDGVVEVSVADNGPGIEPAVAAKIFLPFFTTKPVGQGTGLGLSISQRIVEEHGGTLSFTTEPGRTVFTARLPR